MPATTPEMSDVTTHNIRVGAAAFYLPLESNPEESQYVFGYRVLIVNNSDTAVTLLSRHWIIIDGEGHREDVKGPGVIGQTPTLQPGQAFKYTSFCPLSTPWGTMEGSYQMRRADGSTFDAQIGRFYLVNTATTVPAEQA
jgi:ApaG protein